jgi:hypothetical protein
MNFTRENFRRKLNTGSFPSKMGGIKYKQSLKGLRRRCRQDQGCPASINWHGQVTGKYNGGCNLGQNGYKMNQKKKKG